MNMWIYILFIQVILSKSHEIIIILVHVKLHSVKCQQLFGKQTATGHIL